MQREDFLKSLVASIAYIRLERIARLLGKGCTKAAIYGECSVILEAVADHEPIMTGGFDILFSRWRESTMTSTYCNDLLCSQD
jgi:hypothetical protein